MSCGGQGQVSRLMAVNCLWERKPGNSPRQFLKHPLQPHLNETYGGFMKKSVLFLTAALSFGVAGAQTTVTTTTAQAPALTDVPAGHWAKDAVERLVSQGIILGYPDGTYRGTQNLTRYEAAMIISRLLDQVGSGEVNLGDLDDATMASVRNAINELSAELAALDVRVSDLEGSAVSREDFARLEGRVDAIANTDAGKVAEDLAAVNEMATLLNQDVLELQDRVTAVDGELVSFDERLGVVEDQVAENTSNIDAQGIRIADLEDGRVRLTLGVKGGYGLLNQVSGNTPFDVDRVTENTFAQTEFSAQPDSSADTRVIKPDTADFDDGATGGVTFGIKAENIDAGNGIVVEEAGLDFGLALATLTNAVDLGADQDTTDAAVVTLEGAEVTGRIGDDARFRAVAATGQVELRPDVVNPVGKLADKPGYNDYLLRNGGLNGVAAGVALTDLPLDPTLYVGAGYGTDNNLEGPWFAGRTEVNLGDKADAGLSFVQNNGNRTAFGVDASYIQPKADNTEEVLYGVKAAYVASMTDVFADGMQFDTAFAGREQAAVVTAEANFFNVGADLDFRAVSPGFAKGVAGMDTADRTPKHTDQVGYGASLSTQLGLAEVGAFADTYTNYLDAQWDNRYTGYGAHAGVNLGAFRVAGFAAQATGPIEMNDGTGATQVFNYVASNQSSNTGQVSSVSREDILKPAEVVDLYRYTSSVGALVTHDGSAANPLVPNLNLAVLDNYYYHSGDNYLATMASYDADLGSVTLTPFVGYSRFDRQAANTEQSADNTTLKYGLDVETDTFNVAFKPQLSANVAAANYTALNADNAAFAGQEYGAKVELGLTEFFSPATRLNLGYGYHRAVNLDPVTPSPADFEFGGRVGLPNVPFGTNGEYSTTQGVFTQLVWNEALKLNYGVFVNNRDGVDERNVAHGFKVSYGVQF